MPAPVIVGNGTWQRQSGAQSGVDGNTVFYDVPYRGYYTGIPAFRASWLPGAACPIAGYGHLKLAAAPTIQEEDGGAASAVLRFEGPDINGEFGENEDEITWTAERRTIAIGLPTSGYEGTWTSYIYNAKIALVTYTQDSRRTTPKSAPSLEDPDLIGIDVGFDSSKTIESLVEGTDYEIKTSSVLLEVTKRSDNTYAHKEWHEKMLVAPGTTTE